MRTLETKEMEQVGGGFFWRFWCKPVACAPKVCAPAPKHCAPKPKTCAPKDNTPPGDPN